jgi:hypothetical protein
MSDFEFSPRVKEVVRALPQGQRQEIYHQGEVFHEGAPSLEFSVYYRMPNYRLGNVPEAYLRSVFPEIVDALVWRDLEIADSHDFPGLSPKRAMIIGRLATSYADSLAEFAGGQRSYFEQAATGMVGLHASVLGDETVLDIETARQNLQLAQDEFTTRFIAPLARRGATNMPNIKYAHPNK